MPSPGFDDPAVASLPPAGNLYYGQDVALSVGPQAFEIQPAEYGGMVGRGVEGHPLGRRVNLMFGGSSATTGEGAPIVNAANATSGHWSDVLNFHGSPAPWILLGILIVAGLLHVSAGASGKVEL